MGYEASRGHYVEIPGAKRGSLGQATHGSRLNSSCRAEIDDLYLNNPYYRPRWRGCLQTFTVIREAMKGEGMVAPATSFRHDTVAIEPRGKGLLGVTLCYPYDLEEEKYFGDLPDEKVPKEMLDLAANIVATKAGHLTRNIPGPLREGAQGIDHEETTRHEDEAAGTCLGQGDQPDGCAAPERCREGRIKPRAQTGRRPSQGRGGSAAEH
jgi:hypothetical protein